MHSDVIYAQGEEYGGFSFLHMVPFAEAVPGLDICKPLYMQALVEVHMTSNCKTVTTGHSVGLQQYYTREVFLIFYAIP